MTYDEYIKLLDQLKLAGENRIIGIIPEVEQSAYDALIQWMDESLETKGGSLIASDETIDTLNQFDARYLAMLNEIKSYRGAVSSFVKELPVIGDTIRKFQIGAFNIKWPTAAIAETQKVVVNEIINAYTANGLNAQFVQPLRDLLFQNIIAGTNQLEAKAALKDFIVKGRDKSGKLGRFLTQTSQQAVDSYSGAINKKLMDTFVYPYMIMSGSLIKSSSQQCKYAINQLDGIFNKEDFDNKIRPIAEQNGLIDGTTFENLPFNKFHWGCRHEFTPSMLKPGDKIGENEIFK